MARYRRHVSGCRPPPTAEFYRELLGLEYRAGYEPPPAGVPDDREWLTLHNAAGWQLAFQQPDCVRPSTWPEGEVPAAVSPRHRGGHRQELEQHRDRALALGATQLLDRTDDDDAPLYVLADPAGQPALRLRRELSDGQLNGGPRTA